MPKTLVYTPETKEELKQRVEEIGNSLDKTSKSMFYVAVMMIEQFYINEINKLTKKGVKL